MCYENESVTMVQLTETISWPIFPAALLQKVGYAILRPTLITFPDEAIHGQRIFQTTKCKLCDVGEKRLINYLYHGTCFYAIKYNQLTYSKKFLIHKLKKKKTKSF